MSWRRKTTTELANSDVQAHGLRVHFRLILSIPILHIGTVYTVSKFCRVLTRHSLLQWRIVDALDLAIGPLEKHAAQSIKSATPR